MSAKPNESPYLAALLSNVDQIQNTQELRAALGYLQARLSAVESTSRSGPSENLFMRKLPLELRIRIYELLLVNPYLADIHTISPKNAAFGATTQYQLSPAVLGTCKHIYEEALPILYDRNTFVVSGLGDTWDVADVPKVVECPLTRYISREPGKSGFAGTSQFKKVRNWKLVVSAYASKFRPYLAVQDFCRLVRSVPLKSLKVGTMSPEVLVQWTGSSATNQKISFPMLQQLGSLKLLHIKKLDFEDEGSQISARVRAELKTTVESGNPVDYVFGMYEKLYAYTLQFERSKFYRRMMGVSRWHDRTEFYAIASHPRSVNALVLDHSETEIHVFGTETPHPVELALERAKFASDDNDFEDFKAQRKIILEFLEPQYQRIAAARDAFNAHVKEHRRPGAISPRSQGNMVATVEANIKATILLERYAKTFLRDLTAEVEIITRLHQERFNGQYQDLKRERALAKMSNAVARERWIEWYSNYQNAASDMDNQYFRIRKARKELFDAERPESSRGCDIDIEAGRLDKKLDWPSDDEYEDEEEDEREHDM